MKRLSTTFFVIILILAVGTIAVAQAPTARILIRAGSPGLIAAHPGEFNASSNGLPNAGRGSKVWLEAKAVKGTSSSNYQFDSLTAVSWQILTAPSGSTATIHPTDTANGLKGFTAVFVSDSIGQYLVGLTVTTAKGTSTQTTEYFNAANFVGVGTLVDGPGDAPECAACHDGNIVDDKLTPWKATQHASIFTRGIDGIASDHYSASCLSCHTTGFDKTPTAVNGGFDDRATQYGWTLPPVLKPGNWDSMRIMYPEVAKLANIQCETCHGPGSKHMGAKSKNQTAISFSSEMCGQCHDAPTHHAKNLEWNNSLHATAVSEGANIEALNRDPCAQCHSAQGFVDVTIKGGHLSVPYADVQSVTCPACHDPHDASKPGQLRRASLAEACNGCHMNRVSSRGLHHSHQAPMLDGTASPQYGGQVGIGTWGGWKLVGYQYTNSAHTKITEKCVVCHMAAVPADSLIGKLGDHTFKVAYAQDATHTMFNTNGCVCHGTGGAEAVTQSYVEESQDQVQVLLDSLKALLPLKSGVPYAHTDTSYHAWTATKKAGSYNYYFVLNDGSLGVHNHDYAAALLQSSIDQLKLTAGAASISSIVDVPNDQGKQVQIIWGMFPTENSSTDPVSQYGIWRQDQTPASPISAKKASSLRQMFTANAAVGSRFVVNGSVWTNVGSLPAVKLSMYSFNAPTLFDSTHVSGMKMTSFYITGITRGGVVYSTAADSGYSVDNLAPASPGGLNAGLVDNEVHLGWQMASVPADFSCFAIYRSTSPVFGTDGETPLAKTSDTTYVDREIVSGTTYYYIVAAVDFSGNISEVQSPVHVDVILGVDDEVGLPKQFALKQNYPNPFNPVTEIKYQLPQSAHVKISVYNTLGALVATLVDREETAGYYSIKWSGIDGRGSTVGSGIYLYRIEAGSYVATKKMILLK